MKQFKLRNPSDFVPSVTSHPIEVYVLSVKNDIELLKNTHEGQPLKRPNLMHAEICALDEVANNSLINIKPADKGGGIVIMDTSQYRAKALRQLAEELVYRKLDGDPRFVFESEIVKVTDEAFENDIIDARLRQYLILKNPVTPILYLLPKIHKSLSEPPGRPII